MVVDAVMFQQYFKVYTIRMRLQDKIVVGFVWGLIFFQAISFLYLFAPNLYQQNRMLFLLEIPLFILVVSILCLSYYRSTIEPPGTPNYLTNMSYAEEIEDIKLYARAESEDKKKRRKNRIKGQIDFKEIEALNKVSYCFKCDVVKQKRVHHCSICNLCVMRMDHHCPWVGNCVGKFNHKFFILFLLYATTGLLMVAVSITIDYTTGSFYASLLPSKAYEAWWYIVCISSYMLALSIGFLFVTQMMTAVHNLTTLESFTNGIKQSNPWRRASVVQNLREIFGESNWLIPTNPFPNSPHYKGSSLQQVVHL